MNNDFQRYARIVAYNADGDNIYESEEGQRLRFEVSKNVKSAPNHCSVMVYGIDKDEADAVLVYGSRIELYAGDYDTAGVIFRGSIVDGYYNNGDTPHLQLEALDGDSFYGSYINIAVGAGETLQGVALRAAAMCSSPIAVGMVSNAASTIRLPRGCILFGSTADALDGVARAVNATWFINDERLYLLTETDTQNGSEFEVDTDDDLLGAPAVDAWSIAFSHRINSRVILGATVKFDDITVVAGAFRIVSVDIIGDTRDGEWRMNVWALRQEQDSPSMTALTRNIWR